MAGAMCWRNSASRSGMRISWPLGSGTPLNVCRFSFFFQAEDGIRDLTVTGVQTCALPICYYLGTAVDQFQDGERERRWRGGSCTFSYRIRLGSELPL